MLCVIELHVYDRDITNLSYDLDSGDKHQLESSQGRNSYTMVHYFESLWMTIQDGGFLIIITLGLVLSTNSLNKISLQIMGTSLTQGVWILNWNSPRGCKSFP